MLTGTGCFSLLRRCAGTTQSSAHHRSWIIRERIILHLQKTRPKSTVVLWNSKQHVGGCQEKVSQRAVFWERKPQRSPLNPPYAPGALDTPVGRWVLGSGSMQPSSARSFCSPGLWLLVEGEVLPHSSFQCYPAHLGVYLIVFEMRAVSLQLGSPSAGS